MRIGIVRAVEDLAATPRVILHRGGWGPAPQNTLQNFEDGIASGADAIETDLQLTRDNVLVDDHGPEDGSRSFVRDLDYRDLPLLHGKPWPTFDAFLAITAGRVHVNAELKHTGLAPHVLSSLERVGVPLEHATFSSFNLQALTELRQLRPDARIGVLGSKMPGFNPGLWSIMHASRIGADMVVASVLRADGKYLQRASDAGLEVVTYTPWRTDDSSFLGDLLADPRIAGVIVNQRDVGVATRDGLAGASRLTPGSRPGIDTPWVSSPAHAATGLE